MDKRLIKIELLDKDCLIKRAHEGDAGYDLVSRNSVILITPQPVLVPTGIKLELFPNTEGSIRGRSGINYKTPINVKYGTIDSNYRGEVGVVVQTQSYPAEYPINTLGSIRVFDASDNTIKDYDPDDIYDLIPEKVLSFNGLDSGSSMIRKSVVISSLLNKYGMMPVLIPRHTRIAQLVISPVLTPDVEVVTSIEDTDRGESGYGSSGTTILG